MLRDLKEHPRRRRFSGLQPDAEVRKHGEQMGLETPVVHAVNDERSEVPFLEEEGGALAANA